MGGMNTKKRVRISLIFMLVLLLAATFAVPAFAITEDEVQAQVDSAGRETVTGNVLIWFLCAIGFLKVSQKIDSFMAGLGINVGRTGGSMMAEALIAARGVGTIAGAMGHSFGTGGRGKGASAGASGSASGFFKGGLAGIISRKVTNDAVKTATSETSAVRADQFKTSARKDSSHSAQDSARVVSSHTASQTHSHASSQATRQSGARRAGGTSTTHTAHTSSASSHASQRTSSSFKGVGLGGTRFAKSLLEGGSFANDVIGRVARGDIRSTGSITGDLAAQSLQSYMGYTALGENAQDVPSYSDVEIGGGRITGIETAPGRIKGVEFGMYHADQYAAPEGDYTKVYSADGALWYKQYAQDAVERKPFKAPDGSVDYHERIVKKLPHPPRRKDRM